MGYRVPLIQPLGQIIAAVDIPFDHIDILGQPLGLGNLCEEVWVEGLEAKDGNGGFQFLAEVRTALGLSVFDQEWLDIKGSFD